MAKTLLNIYPRLYVGVQGKKQFDTENPPLAFATQVGTDKAWEKRKSTVDTWAGYKQRYDTYNYNTTPPTYTPPPESTEEGFYIDNEAMSGFYFEKSVTRWETSNKWFAINDPRGFQLQISAENLGDILLNSHISKGMLVGKFLWAKNGQNIYLCREDHPSYQHYLSPPVAREKSSLKVGDIVVHGIDNTKYVFAGKKYALLLRSIVSYRNNETGSIVTQQDYSQGEHRAMYPSGYYSPGYQERQTTYQAQYTAIHYLQYEKEEKSVQAFINVENGSVKLMRTNGKYKVLSEKENVKELPELHGAAHPSYASVYKLFDTKKDRDDYVLDESIYSKYTEVYNALHTWREPTAFNFVGIQSGNLQNYY